MLGELSMEELVMWEENFRERSAGFSSIILKKSMKRFSTESKEQH